MEEKIDLLAAGLSEAEALPMLHRSQIPQSADGWGPWIEWKGGECPIPGVKAGNYSVKWANGHVSTYKNLLAHQAAGWDRHIVAYRVRLTAQQPTEQATAESDRDIDIGDGVDEQKRMVERDEPAKAAQTVPSDPIAALWQAIGDYSVQVSETGECAPPAELLASVEAIQQALTPPAPAKPEPKTADFSAVAPMERLGATRWGAE